MALNRLSDSRMLNWFGTAREQAVNDSDHEGFALFP